MREGMCPLTCEARCFYTMDLECQIFIRIYREKITETIDLSSPSFLDASVKTFYNINFSLIVDVYKCQGIQPLFSLSTSHIIV